jgi:hypothetical protein
MIQLEFPKGIKVSIPGESFDKEFGTRGVSGSKLSS